MRFMIEWTEVKSGIVRMASPDLETAKEESKCLIRQELTNMVKVFDLESPFPYVCVAGLKRTANSPPAK